MGTFLLDLKLMLCDRYVGTEEGILEYHVNIQDRKTFPDFSVK